jgi:pimeloyl-ACP methyl ester carboxylesterase
MLLSSLARILWLLTPIALGGCLTSDPGRGDQPRIRWASVAWAQGTVNVAVVVPENEGTGPHPVVFALPWGAGTADLVESFIRSYWISEPASRGYYVVAPEVRGSTLEDTAGDVIPPIFRWMDTNLSYDPDKVALVGASNGGRGIFFAALAQPHRFHALMGLPGQYSGDAANLSVLQGKPIRFLVGESDTGWVSGTESTVAALASQGITADFEIVVGQGHVMVLDPADLLDWIDAALGR